MRPAHILSSCITCQPTFPTFSSQKDLRIYFKTQLLVKVSFLSFFFSMTLRSHVQTLPPVWGAFPTGRDQTCSFADDGVYLHMWMCQSDLCSWWAHRPEPNTAAVSDFWFVYYYLDLIVGPVCTHRSSSLIIIINNLEGQTDRSWSHCDLNDILLRVTLLLSLMTGPHARMLSGTISINWLFSSQHGREPEGMNKICLLIRRGAALLADHPHPPHPYLIISSWSLQTQTMSCQTHGLTDLLPAGCRRALLGVHGGALWVFALLLFLLLLMLLWLLVGGSNVGTVLHSSVHHLQVFAPEQLQLQNPGQRRFEALSDADALGAGPERVHAASAAGHPGSWRTWAHHHWPPLRYRCSGWEGRRISGPALGKSRLNTRQHRNLLY